MKALDSPLRLFVLISLILIGISGCNNTVTDPINDKLYPALSEENFVANPNLRAKIGSVVEVSLEPWFSPVNDSVWDTGVIGEDLIPYRVTENTVVKIRMESSSHFNAFLVDVTTGVHFLHIDPSNNTATETILAGDYVLHLNSWDNYFLDTTAGPQTLFIQPDGSPNNILISSFGCKNCDLSGMKVTHTNLNFKDFSNSNFSNADFSYSTFFGSRFTNSNLSSAYFFGAMLYQADLSYSNMKSITLRSTDLRFANLGGSDITNGDLRFSDISDANFCGANKTGVITNGIIYNVNTQCWP
jgi:hypothetical protein